MDTSTCAAAINPSHFHRQGTEELERPLAGATARRVRADHRHDEQRADDDGIRPVLSCYDASVHFRHFSGPIAGRRLPTGADVFLAPHPDTVDHDLSTRLRNRPADAAW